MTAERTGPPISAVPAAGNGSAPAPAAPSGPPTCDRAPDAGRPARRPGSRRRVAGADGLRGQAGHRRPGPAGRADAGRAAGQGPPAHRGRARRGQDPRRRDLLAGRRRHVLAHPVHPGPGAVRPARHPHLPGRERGVRHRTRPGGGQLRARRRDQPGSGEGAVRAARGDGRAACLHRRQDLPDAGPVPGARHPEPDRERGRVPAARGAARPLPVQAAGRLSRAGRGTGDRLPDGRHPAGGPAGTRDRRAGPPAAASPSQRVRPPRAGRLRRPAGLRLPHPGRARPGRRRLLAVLRGVPPGRLGIIAAARALALVRGRDFVVPQDVIDVAADVLRHRLVLSYDALADGIPVETDPRAGCCRRFRCRR